VGASQHISQRGRYAYDDEEGEADGFEDAAGARLAMMAGAQSISSHDLFGPKAPNVINTHGMTAPPLSASLQRTAGAGGGGGGGLEKVLDNAEALLSNIFLMKSS
jgi:hypothetical protein